MSLFRAVSSAIRLPERLPGGPGLTGMLGQSMVTNTLQAAIGNYKAVGSLYGVVTRIAESVAMVDWDLYQQTAKGQRTLVDDCVPPALHEASALWMQPNPFFSKLDFFVTDQQYMSLAGKSYWLICQGGEAGPTIPSPGVKASIELWPIHPARIRPVADKDKFISGYVYGYGAQSVPLPREAVVFLRIPDPDNPMDGYGPVQSIMADLDLTKYTTLYGRNYYLNDASPGGVIEFDDPISDADFERQVMRWREQHQGVANAHRVAILERGHWVDRKTTMRDNQYEQLQKANRESVLIPFGMHSASMGISENVNKSNAEVARTDMAQGVLKPRLERIKGAANGRVAPFFGNNLLFDYRDPTPQDQTLKINESNAMWLGGWAMKDEARQWSGFDPIGGADGASYHQPPAPGPTGPSILQDPAGRSVGAIAKAWPRVMASHEADLEETFGGILGRQRDAVIDYLERQ